MFIPHTISIYNVCMCTVLAITAGLVVPLRKRIWGLTAVIAPIITVFGVFELIRWMRTGDTLSGPDTVAIMELVKAYLLVDLVYGAIVDFWNVPLLSGWIHHIAYFYAADYAIATFQDGAVRPFLLIEVPTVILAWGHIAPTLRSDRLFGATFLATRILLPILVMLPMRLTNFVWSVIGIAITVHIYWFGRWIAAQQRRNADASANNE
jgi:hypothetical protein